MSSKFIKLFKKDEGIRTAFVFKNQIYDITPIIGNDFIPIIKDERINSRLFLDYLKNNLKKFRKYNIKYSNILHNPVDNDIHLLIPFNPPEVWGVGVTYKRNRDLHETDLKEIKSKYEGLYDYVYSSQRPEIFFKALAHHCVGTHEDFIIRNDSKCTIVEAELACIYNKRGAIVAYTVANDITAWDIELECPLFLNYAKIFDGCCVIGPSIVPASEISTPLNLTVICSMKRKGKQVFRKIGNTKYLIRNLKDLSDNLIKNRSISDGTVLCTGTAVGIPSHLNCQPGDIVEIEIKDIGLIINRAGQF